MNLKIKKRGQVTLFIILAVIIFVGLIAVLFFVGRNYSEEPEKLNPLNYINKCIRDTVEDSIKNLSEGGGKIELESFIKYQGENYNYLCYQKNYYFPCINQQPLLRDSAEKQIKQYTETKIKGCFNSLKQELEDKGYSISEGNLDYEIEIIPKKILIKIDKKFDISKGESSQSFKSFDTSILSSLYDLIETARIIVNQEAQFCNFETTSFMMLYPQYNIKRIAYDDSRLYKIKEKNTGEEFKFAVRSCALPAGFFST